VFQSITGLGDNIVVGNAETDDFKVNATAIFNNDVTIGASNADTLIIKSNATRNDNLAILGDLDVTSYHKSHGRAYKC
jgi:hypothetical protein